MKVTIKSVLMLALPYIITMFLPIVLIFLLINAIQDEYQGKIIDDKQRSVEVAFDRYLQKIENIEKMSYGIGQSETLQHYIYGNWTGISWLAIEWMEIRDYLSDFMISDQVALMYFYDSKEGMIITTDAAYSDARHLFQFRYQMENHTSQESVDRLKSLVWMYGYSPAVKAVIDKRETEVVEYRIPVPPDKISMDQSQLVIVMETKDIFSDFYEVVGNHGEFRVYHKSQLIFSSDENYDALQDVFTDTQLQLVSVGEDSFYEMVCGSRDRDWTVQVYLPDLFGTGVNQALPSYLWFLIVLTMLSSIVLCIYFTIKNHREILEVLKLFGEQSGMMVSENVSQEAVDVGYKLLRDHVTKMIVENNGYKEMIARYDYSRKYEILDKLVRNTYTSREKLMEDLESIHFELQDTSCVILCIQYESSDYRKHITEEMTVKDFTRGMLTEIIEERFEVFETAAKETICVIFREKDGIEVFLRDIIARLNVEISYDFGIKLKACAGSWVDSLYDISKSYLQAKMVAQYNETTFNKIFLYTELEKMDDWFYYPQDANDKIFNYVVVGRAESAKEVVWGIYRGNFKNDSNLLTAPLKERVLDKLKGMILSLLETYNLGLDVTALDTERNNIREFFVEVCDLLDQIALEIEERRKQVKNPVAIKIMDYVENNYCDSNLSIKQISFMFGLNENYISKLIKATYGENLSVIIERLRIQKACSLILDAEGKNADVAEQTGYVTESGFRRAFKKITGMTPGEYRNQAKQGMSDRRG